MTKPLVVYIIYSLVTHRKLFAQEISFSSQLEPHLLLDLLFDLKVKALIGRHSGNKGVGKWKGLPNLNN